MPSTFAFYRPRGVPRNYIVEITLDLLSSEEADVYVRHLRKGVNDQIKPSSKIGNKQIYEIGGGRYEEAMLPGDLILIVVRDKQVYPCQRFVYTASENGFACTRREFTFNGLTWQADEIDLQKLTMIDWGIQKPDFAQLQSEPPATTVKLNPPSATRVTLTGFLPLAEAIRQINPAEYPHLTQDNIKQMVELHLMPDGTVDMSGVDKRFQRNKRKALAKQEAAMEAYIVKVLPDEAKLREERGVDNHNYLTQLALSESQQREDRNLRSA